MSIRRHHIEPRVCFIDTETTGLSSDRHELMEIGVIAYTIHDWQEQQRLRLRLVIDEAKADPEALKKNHYDRGNWEREALQPLEAFERLAYFLREHATVEKKSRRNGKVFHHAQLAAHNSAFDADHLWTWHRRLREKHGDRLYLPAERNILCTMQAAMNLFFQNPQLPRPHNFKLGTLAEYFGIPFSVNESHTALYDAEKAAELYRVMERFEYGEDQAPALEAA